MSNPVAILRHRSEYKSGIKLHDAVMFWCPGCNQLHSINVPTQGVSDEGVAVWTWNGQLDRTIDVNRSILCYHSVFLHEDGQQCLSWVEDYETHKHTTGNCHSFLHLGVWEFLGDSAHKLAGQKAPMVPLPDWVVRE